MVRLQILCGRRIRHSTQKYFCQGALNLLPNPPLQISYKKPDFSNFPYTLDYSSFYLYKGLISVLYFAINPIVLWI